MTTNAAIAYSAIPRAHSQAAPWYIWCGLIGVSSIVFGLYWDISWHMSIGRDTFWTPAHLLIQFGGILMCLTSAYLIFVLPLDFRRAVTLTSVGGSGPGAPSNEVVASLTQSPPVGPGSGYRLSASTAGNSRARFA